jgi:hypothetical protein
VDFADCVGFLLRAAIDDVTLRSLDLYAIDTHQNGSRKPPATAHGDVVAASVRFSHGRTVFLIRESAYKDLA